MKKIKARVAVAFTAILFGCSGTGSSDRSVNASGGGTSRGSTSQGGTFDVATAAGASSTVGGATSNGTLSAASIGGVTTSTSIVTTVGGATNSPNGSTSGTPLGSAATGGIANRGGSPSNGGSTTATLGGATSKGGATTIGVGGSNVGGSGASGGTTVVIDPNRTRTIIPLDLDWLFNKGDAPGADQTAFADTAWRSVNVPHDFSIEGPFSQAAATTGRGGYLPSGIGWYRKHFTLPQTLVGHNVYVEFDGVMANSDVYVNGVHLGQHPYGYVSFRYDMTANVKFGTENVIAVKTDTTLQPASRFYAGAGIYRHVRVIVTDPMHIDQWATHVTTPAPTTASATIHVETSVLNSGTTSGSVSVQGIVTDGSGTALAPVTTPAQTLAAGAKASFVFDVPVANPKLWSPDAPNMYQLVTKVLVAGMAVDDDVTTFGIRSLTYDPTTGMSINGKSTKFKGVCLHQDYHGLGLAAPQRAMQRRLAQLKTYGVNAVRTSHDPPSPEFLDLCDRMGLLVMDELFDVWTAHKYTDVGDGAAFFNKAGTGATGMPAVPGTPTGATWYQIDTTGVVMRDRNHPSIALYSAGNEIHDSIATRTPILTKIVSIIHMLDPGRAVTQALLQPSTAGDITGATRTIVDVFGANYRTAEVIQAMALAPARAGVLTEIGTATSTWTSVTGNPALTGLFMWTGVDYLGESDGGWPTVGSGAGILDEMGTPKNLAFSWQTTWGAPKTTFATGAVAGKVTLTPDHTSITTDVNDVTFVKAAIPNATAAVTFSIAGPGVIVAVDSGSQTQESFRGNTRNAYGGLAFAIVQATGAGTITITAKSAGLTDGTANIQTTAGKFIPCSGTCD